MDLADSIKAARGRQFPKVTQQNAADLLGVHRVTYANYELGRQPVPDENLFTLAREWKAPELLAFVVSPLLQAVRIPFWGVVPMGSWERPNSDIATIDVPARYAGDDRIAVQASGDSMRDTIVPFDIVIFRLTTTASPGKIVLARSSESELAIKRFLYRGGEPVLVCDNPDYPPLDPKEARIIGQFVALMREDL